MQIHSLSMPYHNKVQNSPNFGYRPSLLCTTEFQYDVRDEFSKKVSDAISNYPKKFQEIIQNNGYNIIVAPSLNNALLHLGISSPATVMYEKNYPRSSMHTEIDSGLTNKNIIIADKRPYSDLYSKNIVNFALSSALTEALELDKQWEVLEALRMDIKRINTNRRLEELNKNEKKLLAEELIDDNGQIKPLEIIPDLISWNLGAGKYGSGLYGVKDKYFMRDLFPTTTACLHRVLSKL